MLPDFNEDGNLPPGTHECGWTEVLARFGKGEGGRKLLCAKLRRALDRAKRCGFLRVILMGSFVTAHEAPPDFDIIWVLRSGTNTDAFSKPCQELLDGNRSRDILGGDVFSLPEDAAMFDMLTGPDGFGFDKNLKKPRGLVILHLNEL